jgi:hypothetical protein
LQALLQAAAARGQQANITPEQIQVGSANSPHHLLLFHFKSLFLQLHLFHCNTTGPSSGHGPSSSASSGGGCCCQV